MGFPVSTADREACRLVLQETVEIPQLQFIDKPGVVQFLDKVVVVPVVVQRQVLGSDHCVPASQTMDFVEVIPFVRVTPTVRWAVTREGRGWPHNKSRHVRTTRTYRP